MFDPIGGFKRMIDQFLAYLDTAYRIDDPKVSGMRRELLARKGELALDPIFETVPRYSTWHSGLEGILTDKTVLPTFSAKEKAAFVELALSGLFDRDDNSSTLKGEYQPYLHQIKMLERGVSDGTPGIVTSGTGSGKTESFLLPVFAQIAKEAVSWPAPIAPLDDSWLDGKKFEYHRRNEHPDRPKAVRALILFPLNALVEDQMVRLRKAIDSPEAHAAMERHFNRNRIFFGRYTGQSPVPGFKAHPRKADDKTWKKRSKASTQTLLSELRRYKALQTRISDDPEVRYVFPATDGGELVARWDMQETPPDILVTNQSILNAMLVREVDTPILAQTRDWLMSNADARFYLVLDELHLIRGSTGAEMAGLIRILIDRLGLTHPEHAHKLRVLSSSASLPMDEENADASIEYLSNMFGSAGTAGSTDRAKTWKESVVPGDPIVTTRPDSTPQADALIDLARALSESNYRDYAAPLRAAFLNAARSIPGSAVLSDPEALLHATRTAAEMLDHAMQDLSRSSKRIPRSVAEIGNILFEDDNPEIVRGLLALRAIPDLPSKVIPKEMSFDRKAVAHLPGFRMHCFVRNIEGMFTSVSAGEDRVVWGEPSIERGQDYASNGVHRLFEMLYCEACGDLSLGGKRGDVGGSSISLLPSPQELEKLPESATSLRFEDASFKDFALFWPNLDKPEVEIRPGTPYKWHVSYLNPITGVIQDREKKPGDVAGHVLRWAAEDKLQNRKVDEDGTAVPFCCPKCGTDYSGRYKLPNSKRREGRKSPIRSFRTGFGKTSQLLATELVASLKSQGGDGKLVAFSDSREDAATLALDVEVQHQRDLRREILITAASDIAAQNTFTVADEDELRLLKERIRVLLEADEDYTDLDRRKNVLLKRQKAKDHQASVPLKDLFEFERKDDQDRSTRPILSKLMLLGSPPVEGADTSLNRIDDNPWYTYFEREGASNVAWKEHNLQEDLKTFRRAREAIRDDQPLDATDLLFSKTYFALEETGLGWPSFYGPGEYTDEMSRDDAMLRIFADAYRITPNQFQDVTKTPWRTAQAMLGSRENRLNRLMGKISQDREKECADFLEKLKSPKLGQTRGDGSIDISLLYFRKADPEAAAWRCKQCGRVHLHNGFGHCTRCGDILTPTDLNSRKVSEGNFLGRRVIRAVSEKESLFRLKCEELTGQTSDPARRLQQFKKVFVQGESESDPDFEWRQLFDTADLLSVTTTMEVGVDIGSLQAVYQGNMPPQRFNYQQRVGRAGRRGQAFSTVLTVCRSKSHDIHYFHNPIEITGAPPPPPFITTGLVDIPSRLLRKFWLVEAFRILREESGNTWPGDDILPGDIHGEFIKCDEYFNPERDWRSRLADALERAEEHRIRVAHILADVSKCDLSRITGQVNAESVLGAIEDLFDEFRFHTMGLASALAERGLIPLYGMPTRSRDLYVDLVQNPETQETKWDTINRDQDMAIFDFAPGSVRTREKLRHRCVGFTGNLRQPNQFGTDFGTPMDPMNHWFKHDFYLRFCEECGAWDRGSASALPCKSCGSQLPDSGIHCITPTAYRSELAPTDETLSSKLGQRITLASLGKPTEQKTSANISVNFAERTEVFLVNPGVSDEEAFAGFEIEEVTDTKAKKIKWFKAWPQLKLAQQAISTTVLNEKEEQQKERYRVTGQEKVTACLASPKYTNSLQIGPLELNPNLRLLDMDVGVAIRKKRDAALTSVRAAAISATEIIVQRAALDLDIAPEEFDALAPNIMSLQGKGPRPYIQIADALPNGSGFCRHLLGGEKIPVSGLLDSILNDPKAWPRKKVAAPDTDHRRTCKSSCYRCLQRYNNRNFHGLLDWRMGLSYLRALVEPTYECGFDSRYDDFEIEDWPETALRLAESTSTFIPGNRVKTVDGRSDIPVFSLNSQHTRWGVVVHPLWDQRRLFAKLGLNRAFVAVDSFELLRRPLHVLDRARERG
ncbi:DEAD/DEAH box helicase [Rhizobium laguerreae]|nr:DEAD/DEAH box helicase [Rhizobium laguerreae]MBY3551101.1 DEAD/DEAH box helicase [Rhizobium laguerreae]